MDSIGPLVPSGFREITLRGLIDLELFRSISILCSLFKESKKRTPTTPADIVTFHDKCRDIEQSLNDVLRIPSKTVMQQSCVLAILIYEHVALA